MSEMFEPRVLEAQKEVKKASSARSTITNKRERNPLSNSTKITSIAK